MDELILLVSFMSKVKIKVDPLFYCDMKDKFPPLAWTICFDINRPSPSLFDYFYLFESIC